MPLENYAGESAGRPPEFELCKVLCSLEFRVEKIRLKHLADIEETRFELRLSCFQDCQLLPVLRDGRLFVDHHLVAGASDSQTLKVVFNAIVFKGDVLPRLRFGFS